MQVGHQLWQIRLGEILSTHAGIEAVESEEDRIRTIFDGGTCAFPITCRSEELRFEIGGVGAVAVDAEALWNEFWHGREWLWIGFAQSSRRRRVVHTAGYLSAFAPLREPKLLVWSPSGDDGDLPEEAQIPQRSGLRGQARGLR